jgi:hypothetical protein
MRPSITASTVVFALLALPPTAFAQADTPPPCPPEWQPPDPAVTWDSGAVRLEAEAIEMRSGDCFFSGVGRAAVSSDPGDPTYRTLEVIWEEQGARVGMTIYFAADEDDWWVTEMRTPVGEISDQAELPVPLDELFRTPRGETFEGDVTVPLGGPQGGELVFDGLRLTAFAPGTGPGPLTGCRMAVDVASLDADDDGMGVRPLDEGQPLAGTGIQTMTPTDAEAFLRDLGLCFTFRYSYPTGPEVDGGQEGYSERWCTAPPSGVIEDLLYLDDGEIVVFVEEDEIMPTREQPPEGWGCPANE